MPLLPEPDAGSAVRPLTAQRALPRWVSTDSGDEGRDAPPAAVPVRWTGDAAPGPAPAAGRPAPTLMPPPRVPSPPGRPMPPPPAPAAPPRSWSGPFVDAGAAAVGAGVAQRMPDGSVVFNLPGAPAPAVQRQNEPPPPDPPPGPVEPPPAEPPPATPAAAAPAPPAEPPDGTPHQQPNAITDELVRALFPRLSWLLRAELRLERERAGSLIRTRH
ncbi:hypothetical protein GCM10027168_74670 [Streptomyces capparidis]